MPPRKRSRVGEVVDEDAAVSSDHAVCDQCRLRKIRCDRERPQCSNCIRAGQECEWSGHGKKPSQTTILSHAVMGLARRLDQLEGTVSRLDSATTSTPSTWSARSRSRAASTTPNTATATERSSISPSSFAPPWTGPRPLAYFRVVGDDGFERCLGPTSLACLIRDLDADVLAPLSESADSVTDEIARARANIGRIIATEARWDRRTSQGGHPPTSPPLEILEAMVGTYLESINPNFPLWTRAGLDQLVASLRGPHEEDRGLVVCANYIVLTTLAAQRRRCRAAKPGSVDVDLIKSFLANARRATANIELLLAPRLLNVKALLSLCVVAQEYFDAHLFESLRNLAVQVATTIGLDRSETSHSSRTSHGLDPEGSQERQNVLYCLRMVDKAAGWATGLGPSMPPMGTADEDGTRSPTAHHEAPGEAAGSLSVATAKLAGIEERIMADIYGSEARSGTSENMSWAMARLGERLKTWRSTWLEPGADNTPELDDDSGPLSQTRTEAAIAFHSARLLLHWAARQDPAVSDTLLDDARQCLRLFRRLWQATSETSQGTNLARLVASYPPLAVCKLFSHMLTTAPHSQADESDVSLLESFVDMLGGITEMSDDASLNSQLRRFCQTVLDLIRGTKGQSQRWPVPGQFSSSSESAIPWPESTTRALSHAEIPRSGTASPPNSSLGTPLGRTAHEPGQAASDLGSAGAAPAFSLDGENFTAYFPVDLGTREIHGSTYPYCDPEALVGRTESHGSGLGEDVYGDGWNWLDVELDDRFRAT